MISGSWEIDQDTRSSGASILAPALTVRGLVSYAKKEAK